MFPRPYGPFLLRLANICSGTNALANIGARRQQQLPPPATGSGRCCCHAARRCGASWSNRSAACPSGPQPVQLPRRGQKRSPNKNPRGSQGLRLPRRGRFGLHQVTARLKLPRRGPAGFHASKGANENCGFGTKSFSRPVGFKKNYGKPVYFVRQKIYNKDITG